MGKKLLHRLPALQEILEKDLIKNPLRKVLETADGFLMDINTSDFIQRTIYLTGDWDESVSEILRHRLKPGMTFVDAGANVGFFSLLAAKLIGPTGHVIAFEPNPAVFEILVNNATFNGYTWIDAHQSGLFDKIGQGTLHIPAENCGAGTMRPGEGGINIPLVRMDDVVKRKVDLLKIDVEGAEVAALRGAQNVLSDCPTVICEVSEYSLRAMGHSHYELYDLMALHKFVPEIISPVRRSNLVRNQVFFQYDVLFTKEGSRLSP
jgi:FkbM family methyltransferase